MGFKRTAEGRVFFKGAEGSKISTIAQKTEKFSAEKSAERLKSNTSSAAVSNDRPRGASQVTQLQIVTLLKALNEKLQTTQIERNHMRKELEATRKSLLDVENKANHTDRGLAALSSQMGQAKQAGAALAQKQLAFEKKLSSDALGYDEVLKRLEVSESRQDTLDNRVNEALNQQAKLVRKIEKSVQDQERFMRKIERIEETVIQTRDSLNAKAMVLLTEKGAVSHSPVQGEQILATTSHTPELAAFQKTKIKVEQDDAQIPGQRISPLRAVGGAMLLIAVAGAGIFAYQTRTSVPDGLGSENILDFTAQKAAPETIIAEQDASLGSLAASQWSVQDDASAFSEDFVETPDVLRNLAPTAPALEVLPEIYDLPENDIGAIDLRNEVQVLAALEENPDALAAELNKIEPGNTDINSYALADVTGTEIKPAALVSTQAASKTEPVPLTRSETPPQKAQKPSEQKLHEFTISDPELPEVMREIESQAFAGVPEAQHDLAAIYTAGHGGVTQDYTRAAYWFEQAADQNVANAAYNLGVLYHQGLGVKPDIGKAINWYIKAAELGHPEASYNLGIAYIEGIGVDYNPQKATIHFENAAKNGVMEAAYNLGLIYENGLLGEAQPDQALMWYKKAADRGSPEARAALEQLAKTLGVSLEDVKNLLNSMNEASVVKDRAQAPVKKTKSQTAQTLKKLKSEEVTWRTQRQNTKSQSVIMRNNDASSVGYPVAKASLENQTVTFSSDNNAQMLLFQIQKYLMSTGLYPGPADGIFGPQIQDAIRSYQAANNMLVNGEPTTHLYEHMQEN